MKYEIIQIKKEMEIYEVVKYFSEYMFVSLEARGINCADYAHKLYQYAEVYVVQVENVKAGMIAFYCNDFKNYKGYLTSIVIKSEYRKKGLGTVLLEVMLRRCKENMIQMIRAEVNAQNRSALSFYESFGFKVVGMGENNSIYIEKETLTNS